MSWLKENIFRLKQKENVEPATFTCRISDKSVLAEFDKIAINAGYKRNELINIVLEKFVKEAITEEMDEMDVDILQKRFTELDSILKKAVNKGIRMALTEDDLGIERIAYDLEDYSISFNEKKINLKVVGQDGIHSKSFKDVYDIAYVENDLHYKVWIYMTDVNWRFYLIK